MNDELGGKIMAKSVALRTKRYSYLTADSNKDKIAKDTKRFVIKRKLEFEDYPRINQGERINLVYIV